MLFWEVPRRDPAKPEAVVAAGLRKLGKYVTEKEFERQKESQ